jgi:hypothetical protein
VGEQDESEPAYPRNEAECEAYCQRLVDALRSGLGTRLVCVLLSGSWARGEARPGSDVDLTVVVDSVDDDLLDRLRPSWIESGVGYANVYGLDEIPAMSREALQMYSVNVRVLHGENPFPAPVANDFARDLAANAEVVARMARNLVFAHWMTRREVSENLDYLLGKQCLWRALWNVAALRTGRFPPRKEQVRADLAGAPEDGFLNWLERIPPDRRADEAQEIARRANELARGWFREVGRT